VIVTPGGKKPVVLILASTFPRWQGDPEPGFILELAKRLCSSWHVVVVCPHAAGAKEREVIEGVEVIRYRYARERWETLVNNGGIVTNLRNSKWKYLLVPSFVWCQAWSAWRTTRRLHVSVVHAHWLIPQGLLAALLKVTSGRKVPYVVTSHGADLFALQGGLMNALKKVVLQQSHSATVVSSAMLDRVVQMGISPKKLDVIPMGVDMVDRFVPAVNSQRSASELLFVGRLVEKKGLSHLLDAMPELIKAKPDTTLSIAGFGPDEERLKAQVSALGLNDRVNFLGAVRQDALPQLYQRAALFVAPFVRATSGDQEGLPVALMEAVGCGCPAIAGNVAGLADIFGSNARQCVVDPRDTAALVAAILAALNDPEAAQLQANQMRAYLIDHLNWDAVAARYSAVLKNASASQLAGGTSA